MLDENRAGWHLKRLSCYTPKIDVSNVDTHLFENISLGGKKKKCAFLILKLTNRVQSARTLLLRAVLSREENIAN